MYFEPIALLDAPAAAVVEQTAELSVLTYNVRGLPWPIALGRGAALKKIGRELAQMRAEGRQPDVVLIQEGFRAEIADLIRESGYKYWAHGPGKHERDPGEPGQPRKSKALALGEGLGKFTGSGLYVLSDAPILDVARLAYRDCAGLDCLANKGVMRVRVALDGVPTPVDVINTHLNSRHASRAPAAEALAAHNHQTRELIDFIRANCDDLTPMLVGGDFNVRHAPARYDFDAAERPYKVVAEYCASPAASCASAEADPRPQPWLRSQDLQAFRDGAVRVQPIAAETLFTRGSQTGRLSDHDGYLVRYRLSWAVTMPQVAYHPAPDIVVKPKLGLLGAKIAWKR